MKNKRQINHPTASFIGRLISLVLRIIYKFQLHFYKVVRYENTSYLTYNHIRECMNQKNVYYLI